MSGDWSSDCKYKSGFIGYSVVTVTSGKADISTLVILVKSIYWHHYTSGISIK